MIVPQYMESQIHVPNHQSGIIIPSGAPKPYVCWFITPSKYGYNSNMLKVTATINPMYCRYKPT